MSQVDRRRLDDQRLDRLIRAFANQFVHSLVDVDDCVQEAWIHVRVDPRRLTLDRGADGLIGWLRTLVRNVVEDLARAELRHRDRAEPIEAAAAIPCPQAGAEAVRERLETLERFALALVDFKANATEEERRVYGLRALDKKTLAEIAAATGLTVDQVRCRYRRAEKKLRSVARRRGLN